MRKERTITHLNVDEVCINVKSYVDVDGQEYLIDKVENIVYFNSEVGREKLLASDEPQTIINAVMAIWGDTPTVVEPVIEDPTIKVPMVEETDTEEPTEGETEVEE